VLAGRGDHILFQETRPEQPRGIIAEFAAGKRRSTVTPFAIQPERLPVSKPPLTATDGPHLP
jgi:hypothetical protein